MSRVRFPVSGAFVSILIAVSVIGCGIGGLLGHEDWGIGNVENWHPIPWNAAYRYQTTYYTVQTNTSADVARFIGEFLENAARLWGERFGHPPLRPRLQVNAYATRQEYENAVRHLVDRPEATAGMYSPVPPGVIYLPYVYFHRQHPAAVLLHEGTHQYMHQAHGFAVPITVQNGFPPEKRLLISVPVWLNEGMAAFMEAASTPAGPLRFGALHAARLRHLQQLIRSGKCPPLVSSLQKPYGSRLTTADYSVFWGLVHYLVEQEEAAGDTSPHRLSGFMAACRNGFFTHPETDFPLAFTAGGRPFSDFDHRWHRYIAETSFSVFQAFFLEPGQTLPQWEAKWKDWALKK